MIQMFDYNADFMINTNWFWFVFMFDTMTVHLQYYGLTLIDLNQFYGGIKMTDDVFRWFIPQISTQTDDRMMKMDYMIEIVLKLESPVKSVWKCGNEKWKRLSVVFIGNKLKRQI